MIPRPTAICGTAGPVLIRLVYEVDPLTCPRCGGEMRVIALIQEPAVIDKILRHLREKGRGPRAGPWATGPPGGGAGAEKVRRPRPREGGGRPGKQGKRRAATGGRETGGEGGWATGVALTAGAAAGRASGGWTGDQKGTGRAWAGVEAGRERAVGRPGGWRSRGTGAESA